MKGTWLIIALLLVAGSARADGLDAERFVPAAGAAGELQAESPVVPLNLGFGLGLFLNVADDIVVERDDDDDIVSRPLDHAFTADLLASIGLFDVLELGVHLPVQLVYDGDTVDTGAGVVAASSGVGDLRFVPKLTLWGTGSVDDHLVLGLAIPVSLPTGDADALRGAGSVTVAPTLLALIRSGRLAVIANAGYHWRADHPVTLPWGDEIAFAVSALYELSSDAVELFAELDGGVQLATEVDGGEAEFPVELLAGATLRIGESWKLYGGAGLGVTNGIGSPDVRVLVGVRFAKGLPQDEGFGDSDGDGIIDRSDDCPEEAEDEDGFLDEDGCPEPDNDNDGIADADDECPLLPEESGGDGDGCPERTHVALEEGTLIIYGKVLFKTGSSEVRPSSEQLLDQIAVALKANPHVRIRVEGHTDDVGPDETNQRLSQERARSVAGELEDRGIDDDRLESTGFGESRPIAPNRTAAGRARNRRVEFIIIDGGSKR